MPHYAPSLKAAVDGIAAAGRHISFHTADPGSTGANEVTGGSYARQPTTWDGSNTGGTKVGSKVSATGLPANVSIGWWALQSAVSGGVVLYSDRLRDPADETKVVTETYGAAGGTQELTPRLVVTNPA